MRGEDGSTNSRGSRRRIQRRVLDRDEKAPILQVLSLLEEELQCAEQPLVQPERSIEWRGFPPDLGVAKANMHDACWHCCFGIQRHGKNRALLVGQRCQCLARRHDTREFRSEALLLTPGCNVA